MTSSFRHQENYKDHNIEVITWHFGDGWDCTFSIEPVPNKGVLHINTGLHGPKYSSEAEAKQTCLVEVRRLIDAERKKA
jgi:hypothetical protein